ncbi:MAG: MobP3 family relaxase [Thermacetogeniaceae bacterium]
MHSPFFFKQSFYLPTETNASKNAANIQYIATRPGADRGDLEPETSEAERNPKEISLEQELGPVNPGTAAGHVKYMSERPGSHGLFDADGVVNLKAAMDEIKHHKGIVWRDVVSLHEDDASRLGYTTREAWENALRRSMPDVVRAMGISETNLRWVAAFQQKAGHPHCYISFWEQNPERDRGVVSQGERRDMRKSYMNVIYENERARLYLEKNTIRDLIRD